MKIIYLFLRIAVGSVFIISGVVKLFPAEVFETALVESKISNWFAAPILARLIISLELFLGLSILVGLWLRRIVYYVAQCTLIVFTIYLFFLLYSKGSSVDCGCFGNFLKLTPTVSILKNIFLMAILFFIPKPYFRYISVKLTCLTLLLSIILPFTIAPISLHNVQGIEVNEPVDFSALPSLYDGHEQVNFSKGKKIVVFLSYRCEHCINATKKLVSLNKVDTLSNLYLVVGAQYEEGVKEFIEKTGANFPLIWMSDDTFFNYRGGKLPSIVYIENGFMKKKWFGDRFDVNEMENYFTH